MKVLITGAKGQLGSDLIKVCIDQGIQYVDTDIHNLDITKKEAVHNIFLEHKFDVVLHCAAYTAVDQAEDNQELCYQINVEGTNLLVQEALEQKAKFVYISTDYVFKGLGVEAYKPEDKTDPQSYYGLTKFLGEEAVRNNTKRHFIIRISWAFGLNGKNFIRTMLRVGRDNKEIRIVNDQIGSPTYTKDLAKLLIDMIQTEKFGTYHASNEGYCSWAEFAEYVFKRANYTCKVVGIPSDEYPTRAKRPLNSRLSKEKIDEMGFSRLPDWQDAVDRYLHELSEAGEL